MRVKHDDLYIKRHLASSQGYYLIEIETGTEACSTNSFNRAVLESGFCSNDIAYIPNILAKPTPTVAL